MKTFPTLLTLVALAPGAPGAPREDRVGATFDGLQRYFYDAPGGFWKAKTVEGPLLNMQPGPYLP